MKCIGCGINDKQGICIDCWDELQYFQETLYPSRKTTIMFIMENDDRWKVYQKCKGKPRNKQLKIIRNYFNRACYGGIRKDGKKYCVKY